jgi:peptide-methionine (R)-S-oxide reductase
MTVQIDKSELRQRLTPLQYAVTQDADTERPFTGAYWDNHDAGSYRCVVCGQTLFESTQKYDSNCGWPSFFDVLDKARVATSTDASFGMKRTEVRCANCGAHLGHIFDDGPKPTGLRYCINSASLDFDKAPGK